MRANRPIFKQGDAACQVDRCRPQRQAIEQGKIRFHALARGGYPGTPLPPNALPGIRCMGFWDAVGPQDWGLDWHRNDGLELCFLETGSMPFCVEGRRYALGPGDLTITLPWQGHVLGNPNIGPGRIYWVLLDIKSLRPNTPWRWPGWVILTRDDLDELTSRLRSMQQPLWQATRGLGDDFRALAEPLQSEPKSIPVSAIAIQINRVLLNLLELLRTSRCDHHQSANLSDQTVQLFVKDLSENLAAMAEPWNVHLMARHCGMGVTVFTDTVRRLTNTTPMAYLMRCRLSAAAHLITRHPDRRIIDIALQCGFSSSQYFATRFQRQFGQNPTRYRLEHAS